MTLERNRITVATLRAYLDQTLPHYELKRVEQHVESSPDAQAILRRLRQDMAETGEALALLAPTDAAHSPPPEALMRLKTRLAREASIKNTYSTLERILAMLTKSFIKRHQPAVIALALILTFAVALSFAPVRAFAGDLLKIFRVQEVKVVPVDVGHLENIESNEELSGLLEQFSPDEKVLIEGGEPVEVASLSEAAAMVDFPVAEVTNVPAGAGPLQMIGVGQESVYEVQLDPDLMEAIFAAADIDIDLPDSLHDTPVTVTRPTMLLQRWGDDDMTGLGYLQLRSPQIEYPDDLDLDELGVAMLQFLGYSKAEAIALGASINWANTIVLPIPTDADYEVTDVSVNGASGTLFEESPESGSNTMLMWQKGGMSYLLIGPYNADQILEIAESVR